MVSAQEWLQQMVVVCSQLVELRVELSLLSLTSTTVNHKTVVKEKEIGYLLDVLCRNPYM